MTCCRLRSPRRLPASPEATDSAVGRALASRPDLDAARRERDRAEAGLRLQRALRTPSFSVGAGLKRDFGTNGLVVTFGVPLPLFNRNEAGVARAGAEQRQAAARLAAVETRVSLDVQEALNAVDVSRRRVSYVEGEYLKNAREARDIVLASYRSGAATLIDYLDAQRALREALRTQNRARFDYRISLFQYEAAVGDTRAGPGKGTAMKSQWIGLALLGLVACGACKATSAEGPKPEAQESKSAEKTEERNTVRAAGELQKKWGIDVAQATRTTVAGAITHSRRAQPRSRSTPRRSPRCSTARWCSSAPRWATRCAGTRCS